MVAIAMWSGPRNLSTAMMYAFAQRADCAVWDEPFYAPYLLQTGAAHPMRDTILAAHETDANKVAARCADLAGFAAEHVYMKHMPHHMVPGMPLDWAESCVNVHLIRHPARVIASYLNKRAVLTMEDIGFARQAEIFNRLGGIVIDSTDIRRDPARALGVLCDAIGLPFDPAMLRWPAGGRAEDGVWAAHWYDAIHRSTGFAGKEGPLPEIPAKYQGLLKEAVTLYDMLHVKRITV